MESEKYLEGQSMQRPLIFESDGFIYWKNIFETYVKSKDLDLWHVITYGDFPLIQNNPETKKDEIIPFDKQSDDLKKKLAKNNEAKMVIYNALPRKEYERIFMCKTAKEIWDTLLITHQGFTDQSCHLSTMASWDLLVEVVGKSVLFSCGCGIMWAVAVQRDGRLLSCPDGIGDLVLYFDLELSRYQSLAGYGLCGIVVYIWSHQTFTLVAGDRSGNEVYSSRPCKTVREGEKGGFGIRGGGVRTYWVVGWK
ncbi:hypothetical protein Tco_0658539 [Tanacetum coccineum]